MHSASSLLNCPRNYVDTLYAHRTSSSISWYNPSPA
jgi:hypothetical protein